MKRKAPLSRGGRLRSPRHNTGFASGQRLEIRVRAGLGDPFQALCEICGIWLGLYGGQVHHRHNRQSGGSRLANVLSNGVLACGTPLTGCHGKCTIGTGPVMESMKDRGFVLITGQDPLLVPILMPSTDGDLPTWLTNTGTYSAEAPLKEAA